MCDQENDNQSSGSGFIFGLVIGAVIAAVVAIYIYKNKRSVVFANLKTKLEKYFSRFTNNKSPPSKSKTKHSKLVSGIKSPKISVVLPSKIVESTKVVKTTVPKPRKFLKPKK